MGFSLLQGSVINFIYHFLLQYSSKYLANCKGVGMVKPWIIPIHSFMMSWEVKKVFGRDGKRFLEHCLFISSYLMTLMKWASTCCVTNLFERAACRWNQSGCQGLGREHWRRAGKGLRKCSNWWHDGGTLSWEEGCGTWRRAGEGARGKKN